METPVMEQLLNTLQDLGDKELSLFQWYLQHPELLGGFPAIKVCHLQNASREKTVDLMVGMYRPENVMQVARFIQSKIMEGQSQEEEKLEIPGMLCRNNNVKYIYQHLKYI